MKTILKIFSFSFLIVLIAFPATSAHAKPFSFSEAEAQDKAEEEKAEADNRALIEELKATPCSKGLANSKTALIIAERSTDGVYQTNQLNYGLHYGEIKSRLRDLGMRTYTQEEIHAQIKSAEIQATMNNDPDAAISAASRLGARFILRGLIESRATFNTVARVNEVHISMSFTLVNSSGKTIASVSKNAESYSGSDTAGMALTLVKENADFVVATLYSEYCKNAQ